jgi:hypothetical protein
MCPFVHARDDLSLTIPKSFCSGGWRQNAGNAQVKKAAPSGRDRSAWNFGYARDIQRKRRLSRETGQRTDGALSMEMSCISILRK